ncbi:hypothetical protein [Rubritalea tangerina]|uniref:DUF3108 domain-containing protein n=1 Tax=Rubritalea tangerina TaxID=430798 RepID=A0ABW4ZEU6_9BACT
MQWKVLSSLICLSGSLYAGSALRDTPVRLKHFVPQLGETVAVHIHSFTGPGEMTTSQDGQVKKGEIEITWQQELERTEVLDNGVKKLRYKVLKDTVVREVTMGGEKDTRTTTSPLVGKTVEGMQDASGTWRLFLDSAADAEQAVLMDELESYEKRRWFIEQPVRIGTTWDFSPSFIKHIMERDLKGAKVIAKMKLKDVKMLNQVPVAVVSFSIKSAGVRHDADASISLDGEVWIDMKRMFDYKITMQGEMTTASSHGGTTTVVKTPVKYLVTKELKSGSR